MSLLRAQVYTTPKGWMEIKLLDLKVVADGENETAMLRQLEYMLTAEYHLALRFGQTPFVNILLACPKEVSDSWNDGGKKLRSLTLPDDVRQALSAVFHKPRIGEFNIALAA